MGNVVSNISQKGRMESITLVEEYFQEELLRKAVNLSKNVIKKLELEVQFGELGLDVMFDRNFNPYLIKINSKPGFEGPQTLAFYGYESQYGTFLFKYSNNDRQEWGKIVNELFINPFLYAKELVKK